MIHGYVTKEIILTDILQSDLALAEVIHIASGFTQFHCCTGGSNAPRNTAMCQRGREEEDCNLAEMNKINEGFKIL